MIDKNVIKNDLNAIERSCAKYLANKMTIHELQHNVATLMNSFDTQLTRPLFELLNTFEGDLEMIIYTCYGDEYYETKAKIEGLIEAIQKALIDEK